MLRQMIVRIPHALLKRVKHAAIERDVSLQALVTEALERFLKEDRR